MYIPPTIYYSIGDTKYLILCPITSEKIKLRNMILFLLTSFVRNIITCSSCLVPYARLKLKQKSRLWHLKRMRHKQNNPILSIFPCTKIQKHCFPYL